MSGQSMGENVGKTADAEIRWFERVPKVELHLHLEGAIPHQVLWELVQKYGGDPSIPDLQALQQRFNLARHNLRFPARPRHSRQQTPTTVE